LVRTRRRGLMTASKLALRCYRCMCSVDLAGVGRV